MVAPAPPTVPTPALAAQESKRVRRIPSRWMLGALMLVCLLAVGIFVYSKVVRRPLDQFWSGLRTSEGVTICLGQPAAFNFRSDEKQVQLWEGEFAAEGRADLRSIDFDLISKGAAKIRSGERPGHFTISVCDEPPSMASG